MYKATLFAFVLAAGSFITGCATAPDTTEARHALNLDSQGALAHFKDESPGMNDTLDTAYGYAIFPDIGKAAFIAGGAYGKGTVYEQGKLIGYADVSAGTIGLQAGGETFSELILFKDKNALDKFVNNQLAFDAKASAVAIKPGVATAARYSDGVAIFARTTGGLMVEAAVGGQKFTFRSLDDLQRAGGAWDNSASTPGYSSESVSKEMRSPTTLPTTMPGL